MMMRQDNTPDQYGSGYSGYSGQGGYSGYTPQAPEDDPYGSQGGYYQQSYGQQQQQQQYVPPSSYQQSSFYQAPSSVASGSSAYDSTTLGLSGRLEALLSYLLGWFIIPPIIAFVIERKNRFVRFAAAQSALFFIAFAIVYGILRFLGGFFGGIFLIGPFLGFVFGLIAAIVVIIAAVIWLYAMLQAYRGKTVRLPFFSGYADSLVNMTTRKRKV